jgi:hypothetical protein
MTDSGDAQRSDDPLTCLTETVAHILEALSSMLQDLPAGPSRDSAATEIGKAYRQMGGVVKATDAMPQAFS